MSPRTCILDDRNGSSAEMTVTQTVTAATTGSTLSNTYQASFVPIELTVAINTIAANQQSLYQHIAPLSQQIAVLSFKAQPATQACQPAVHVPPIQNLATLSPPACKDIRGGASKGTNKAMVGVGAQVIAATDAATQGGVVVAPPLLITWTLKVVGTGVAPVPFLLLLVTLSALSSPIR
jgi:hypothetical protein